MKRLRFESIEADESALCTIASGAWPALTRFWAGLLDDRHEPRQAAHAAHLLGKTRAG
jgi:hypothetical protein